MPVRVIMLVDLDYFFAQCEERRTPSIKDKPVVICVYSGRTEESGAVSTANYIARRYGVTSGMPIYLAKKRVKQADAVFLPMDRRFYEEVSDKIMGILKGYADRFEQVGIDEAYLDVTHRVDGSIDTARILAQEIKNGVRATAGLTCSVGVGPNKLVAKIAADFRKPDGLTIVGPDGVEKFLAPLPVSRLPGVGEKTGKRLEALGIRTIGDLAKYDMQRLIEAFGKNLAAYLHNASVGIDETPVQERGEAESISRIATLKENTRSLEIVTEKTDTLCRDIHEKLLQRGLSFKSVGVMAVMKDMSTHSRSVTLESPTNELEVLKRSVEDLFRRLLDETELELRRAGVRVSGLAKGEETQRHLTDYIRKS